MNHDDLRLIIGLLAGLGGAYIFVTRPIQNEIKTQIAQLELKLMTEIHNLEKRLNDRINSRITLK